MQQYFLNIQKFYFIAAVFAALVIASGCGGENNSSPGGASEATGANVSVETGSLSKAEFIERADKMCEAANKQTNREYNAYVKAPSGNATLEVMVVNTILIPTYTKLVNQISSLRVPRSDEEHVTDFVSAIQRALDRAQAEPSKLFEKRTPFPQAAKLAKTYGLTGCAKSLA
jgi:hypothetical protein